MFVATFDYLLALGTSRVSRKHALITNKF